MKLGVDVFHQFDSLISFPFEADLMIRDTWSETIRNYSVALLQTCSTLTETDKTHFPKELSYLPATLSKVEWSSSYRHFLLIKSWFVSPNKWSSLTMNPLGCSIQIIWEYQILQIQSSYWLLSFKLIVKQMWWRMFPQQLPSGARCL